MKDLPKSSQKGKKEENETNEKISGRGEEKTPEKTRNNQYGRQVINFKLLIANHHTSV